MYMYCQWKSHRYVSNFKKLEKEYFWHEPIPLTNYKQTIRGLFLGYDEERLSLHTWFYSQKRIYTYIYFIFRVNRMQTVLCFSK